MKLSMAKSLVFTAGIFGAISAAGEVERDINNRLQKHTDPRANALVRFLTDRDCPAAGSAGVFVHEADEHHLDWRLLPSLAFLETTGGKFGQHNNLFGWANGVTRFGTRREAIHEVARALAEAPAYRGKDLKGKLWSFNHSSEYRLRVLSVMEQISPSRLERSLAE
jgi:hypothetical protein